MKFTSFDIVFKEEEYITRKVNLDSLSEAVLSVFSDAYKADAGPDDEIECDCGIYFLQCCKISLLS